MSTEQGHHGRKYAFAELPKGIQKQFRFYLENRSSLVAAYLNKVIALFMDGSSVNYLIFDGPPPWFAEQTIPLPSLLIRVGQEMNEDWGCTAPKVNWEKHDPKFRNLIWKIGEGASQGCLADMAVDRNSTDVIVSKTKNMVMSDAKCFFKLGAMSASGNRSVPAHRRVPALMVTHVAVAIDGFDLKPLAKMILLLDPSLLWALLNGCDIKNIPFDELTALCGSKPLDEHEKTEFRHWLELPLTEYHRAPEVVVQFYYSGKLDLDYIMGIGSGLIGKSYFEHVLFKNGEIEKRYSNCTSFDSNRRRMTYFLKNG